MNERVYQASAPAKVILCGEHAVVYGYPAIAVPVSDLRATAYFHPDAGDTIRVELPDVGEVWSWPPGPQGHPLALLIRVTLEHLNATRLGGRLVVRSQIPVGGGMGSSAAVATAVVRVMAHTLGRSLSPEEISRLVYKAEEVWHGTPSGIDNTVIAYECPVWFVRGKPPHPFYPARPFTLVIADSGVSAPTREVVLDVRRKWEADRARYEAIFRQIGHIVENVRTALEAGDLASVGELLNANQQRLAEMGVSSPLLEKLVAAARAAGALGAKLAGAGRGGNVIALVREEDAPRVAKAMQEAGAKQTLTTVVRPPSTRGHSAPLGATGPVMSDGPFEVPKAVVIDTSVFVNPDTRQLLASDASGALQRFLELARARGIKVYVPVSVSKEMAHFIRPDVMDRLKAQATVRAPDLFGMMVPAAVLHFFVREIRKRIDKGLRLAEQAVRVENSAENVRRLREQYREAVRSGIVDSVEDLDVVLLAKEVGGAVLTADEGIHNMAHALGVESLTLRDFMLKLGEKVAPQRENDAPDETSAGGAR